MELLRQEAEATALGVLLAIVPLALLFLVFQVALLRLPRKEVREIMVGTAVSTLGLFLFLLGVGIGFLPFGRAIGEALGRLDRAWLFLGAGLLLGFFTAWGEPAVRILASQVEHASAGAIRAGLVLWAVSLGVAGWAGLGMLRISQGIPLLHLLVPGYLLVLVLMRWVDQEFLAIAVDAGGVATGPLANSFLLALALGASAAKGEQDALVHGFGFVALIALAPIMSLMLTGLLVRWAQRGKE